MYVSKFVYASLTPLQLLCFLKIWIKMQKCSAAVVFASKDLSLCIKYMLLQNNMLQKSLLQNRNLLQKYHIKRSALKLKAFTQKTKKNHVLMTKTLLQTILLQNILSVKRPQETFMLPDVSTSKHTSFKYSASK